jgi:hypothetical protein
LTPAHGRAAQVAVRDSQTTTRLKEKTNMEDFPIWLKLTIWGMVGLTVLYSAWGIVQSMLAS